MLASSSASLCWGRGSRSGRCLEGQPQPPVLYASSAMRTPVGMPMNALLFFFARCSGGGKRGLCHRHEPLGPNSAPAGCDGLLRRVLPRAASPPPVCLPTSPPPALLPRLPACGQFGRGSGQQHSRLQPHRPSGSLEYAVHVHLEGPGGVSPATAPPKTLPMPYTLPQGGANHSTKLWAIPWSVASRYRRPVALP